MPAPEVILWSYLRNKMLAGHRFRRQYGIDRYVVDFYCPKAKLVIEIDGDSHFNEESQEYDRIRDDYVKSLGMHVIRFTNRDVCENLDGVLQKIKKLLKAPPSEGGERGGQSGW